MAQPLNTKQSPFPSATGFTPQGGAPIAPAAPTAPMVPPQQGGQIAGPGTGTSDSIATSMKAGTFIMPADSVKALGIDTLNQLANSPPLDKQIPFEQAHAAGTKFLTSLRDATHKPVDNVDGDADTEGAGDMDEPFANGGPVYARGRDGRGAASAGYGEEGRAPALDAPMRARGRFANGGEVAQTERTTLNSNGTVQGANGNMVPGHDVAVSGGRGAPSIPDTGRPFGFTNPDYWRAGFAEEMRRRGEPVGSRLASGPAALSLAGGPVRMPSPMLANGGPVGRGFKPQRLFGGGNVLGRDDTDIYANAGINADDLGSSGKFVQVPDSIGQQPGRQVQQVQAAPQSKQQPQVSVTPATQVEGWRTKAVMDGAAEDAQSAWDKGQYSQVAGALTRGAVTAIPTAIGEVAYNTISPVASVGEGFLRGLNGESASNSDGPTTKPKAAPPKATTPNPFPQDEKPKTDTSALQERLASKGREGMTNAEVAQANPDGVVTMKRDANGVPEFSGNNIKGQVSYADGQGNAIAGAGQKGLGFGRVDVAPAGANVVMGDYGYAFANQAPKAGTAGGVGGFLPVSMRQGAASDPMAGMSVDQRLQYNKEVAQAQATNAMQQRLIASRRPEGTVMDGLMERTPDQQRHDAEVQASSITSPATAERGKAALARLSAEGMARASRAAQQATTEAQNERQQRQDAISVVKDERAYQDGAPGRVEAGLKAQGSLQLAQARAAFQNAATPEERAIAQRSLAALSGKTAADRMQVVNLPDTTTDAGAVVKGGQALVRTLEDGTVVRVPIDGQGEKSDGLPSPKSKAEFAALPKGTRFIDPNGQVRVK